MQTFAIRIGYLYETFMKFLLIFINLAQGLSSIHLWNLNLI